MTARNLVSDDSPSSLFEAYLASVFGVLSLEPPLEDGVTEVRTEAGLVSLTMSRANRFCALRLSAADGGLLDTGCLPVSPSQVRWFVRELSASPQTEKLEGVATSLTPSPLRPAHRPLPSFPELVAALASGGRLTVTAPDLLAQVDDLRLQASFLQETVREQSDEIRQLKAQAKQAAFVVDPIRFANVSEVQDATPSEDNAEALQISEVGTWYARNLERIAILPRALNSCRKAIYAEPSAFYTALEFLAGPFREARSGRISREELQTALEATGLRLSGSTTPIVAGSHGDAYFVQWLGRRRFLDLHLAKGGGRDERYCLRIYFFWCGETQKAVVGSMPAHLVNSLA